MGAVKRYIEDVLYDTTDAVFTEASEPLKAYGDFSREEFAEATAEHLFEGDAIKVWNFIRGLKGDMEYDAETPLLDKAKEKVFTLVPFGDVARDLAQFTYDYDPYGFRDAWDDMDDCTDDNIKLISSDPGSLLEWLKECLDDMNSNYEFYIDMIADCEKLIKAVEPLTERKTSC